LSGVPTVLYLFLLYMRNIAKMLVRVPLQILLYLPEYFGDDGCIVRQCGHAQNR
jgi:hypothetical protein